MNIVDTTSKQQLRYRVPFPEGDVWGNSLKGQVRIEFGLKLVEVERGEIWVNEHRNVLESIFEETPLVTNSFHRIAGAIGRFGFEREALGMLAALTPQRRSRIEQVMLEAEPGTPLALTDEQKRVISRFSQAVGGKSKALLPAYYEFDQLQELAELLETYPVSTAKQLYLHLREGSIIGDARECLSKWEEVRPMLEVILEEEDERFLGLLERYRKNGLIEKMMSLPRYPGQNRTDLWYAVHPELVEHHYGELCEYLEQHPVFGVMVLSAVGEHTLNLEKQCGDLVTRIIQIYGEDDREDEVRLALKALKPEIWHLRPELDRLLEQTRVGFHSVLENDLAAVLQPSSVTTYHLA
ncbi:MAG: hypothetical protein KDD55_11835, partial [Bdellovibrionales bacterium]|nr:hypothetical protein [Bdellovibrionales bacterium]